MCLYVIIIIQISPGLRLCGPRLTAQNRCSLAPPLVKLVYVYLTFGCFRGSVPPRLKMILQLFLLCALYL